MSLQKVSKTRLPGVFVWKIQLRLPTRRIHTHVQMTEEAARAAYSELLGERSRARLQLPYEPPKPKMKLADARTKYEHELLMTGKNADHISGVHFTLGLLESACPASFPIAMLNREHVRLWTDERAAYRHEYAPGKFRGKAGPRTINKGLAHLSAFFTWCCREGLLASNPAEYAPKVKEAPLPIKALSWKHYSAFADAAWKRRADFGLFVEVLGETGARVDEAIRANRDDVHTEQKTWQKLMKPGRWKVMDAEQWVLRAATGKHKPLCPTARGKRFTYTIVRKLFAKCRADAGLPYFTPHHIRHGRACWDLMDGKTVHQVKEKLGHSSVLVTERYLRAAELLRREEAPGAKHVRDLWQDCGKVPPTPANSRQHPSAEMKDKNDAAHRRKRSKRKSS